MPDPSPQKTCRQGTLLAFGLAGAMTVAMTGCRDDKSATPMLVPPNTFTTNQAVALDSTNAPPTGNYVHATGGGYGPWLYGRGYYPIYGFPDYYARPVPGTTFQLVQGASTSYRAGSASEANESVSRGGFGSHGGGEGGGE